MRKDMYSEALILSDGRYERMMKFRSRGMEDILLEPLIKRPFIRVSPNVVKILASQSSFPRKEVTL